MNRLYWQERFLIWTLFDLLLQFLKCETLNLLKNFPIFVDTRTNFEMTCENKVHMWMSNLKLKSWIDLMQHTSRERIYEQNCISIFSSMCKHFSEIFAIMSSIKFVLHHNAFCELFSLQSQHFFPKVYFRNLKKVSHTKWIEKWHLNKSCDFVKCHIIEYVHKLSTKDPIRVRGL